MQQRINNFLNRPFPLFLACRKGQIYFIWLILILVAMADIFQPFGLVKSHEFHRPLVLNFYIVLYFGMYAVLYFVSSHLRPQHYAADSWTVRKELRGLLVYIPATAVSTYLFAYSTVQGFELSLPSFVELQSLNSMLTAISAPTFGYFIDTRLATTPPIAPPKPPSDMPTNKKSSRPNLTEQQAHTILQQLGEAIETRQLHLLNKCSLQQVSTSSGIPVHHISYVVNTHYRKSFTDYINEFRCKEACRMLESKDAQHLTIEAIGIQCGFGTRANFQQVFKKMYGINPSDYQTRPNK
jgi:AraC-like DNA-binding protein